jgi:hypothetical protein
MVRGGDLRTTDHAENVGLRVTLYRAVSVQKAPHITRTREALAVSHWSGDSAAATWFTTSTFAVMKNE